MKIGIDVGGTFTHAVAVDAPSASLLGAVMVPTTHAAAEGVALGVVESLQLLVEQCRLGPDEVTLIAHSTTQATNALLEGDVAPVGIVGMGRGWEGWRARSQTRIEGIDLAPGKPLRTCHQFLDTGEPLDGERIARAIDQLHADGAEVFVVSEAFGVDNPANEHRVAEAIRQRGGLATAASDISRLYGLKVRTRTAVINASMLPRMLDTAARTEQAVRTRGFTCPLMVMRSDGGIMDVEQMRRRPILTMLSGPAAGVAAALAFAKVSDGIFLEVGGTSTDVSVIRNGRPEVRSAEIGGHRLFVRTLDIRTVAIGGGSMVRLRDHRVADVGPRSAHIAGLGYPSFAGVPAAAASPIAVHALAPRPGDPADYAGMSTGDGNVPSLAYTVTDAANALGRVTGHARATSDLAGTVTGALAARAGMPPQTFARQVLDAAAAKVASVVEGFIDEYRLDREGLVLVGGGGGAEVVVPPVAERMKLDMRLADRAEVISAIGVALGMIQDTVERTVVNPTDADLVAIRRAVVESVTAMGAFPDSIEVKVEVDARQKRLVATARGTPELRARERASPLPERDLARIASASCGVDAATVESRGRAGGLTVFSGRSQASRGWWRRSSARRPACVLDDDGVVRLKVADAVVSAASLGALGTEIGARIEELTVYGDAGGVIPDVFLAASGRVIDLSGLATREQVLSLVRAECETLGGDEPAVAIVARRRP